MNTNNSNLEFRKIKSLNFLYEINSNGTIFRNVKSKKQSKIKLDMHHSDNGYYVTFVHIGGRKPDNYSKRVMIHRVVAECWLGDCPKGYEVDHIDRNSHNNDYRNLRYVTHSEQMKNRDHTGIGQRDAKKLEEHRRLIMVPVSICKSGTNEWLSFESLAECGRYLSSVTEKTERAMQARLSDRRKFILGYDIIYGMQRLDTAALRSKEQSA